MCLSVYLLLDNLSASRLLYDCAVRTNETAMVSLSVAGRISAATLAILVIPIAALAYSPEAVKDAQHLVRVTANKSQAGIADASEAALARYHLLAMEYKAQLIPHAAYCKLARPQLQVIAANLPSERYLQFGSPGPLTEQQQVDMRKQWQDQVGAMSRSAEACDAAIATTESVVFGADNEANSKEAVNKAESWSKLVEQRYAAGTSDAIDIAEAKLDLLSAQYRAGQVSLPSYCQSGRPTVIDIETSQKNQKLNGVDQGLVHTVVMKRHVYQFKALCHAL